MSLSLKSESTLYLSIQGLPISPSSTLGQPFPSPLVPIDSPPLKVYQQWHIIFGSLITRHDINFLCCWVC